MKKFLLFAPISLILILSLFLISKRDVIVRLNKVVHLFDADVIVHNFSNMDNVMPAHSLPRSGDVHVWPVSLDPLPQSVAIAGQRVNLSEYLKETSTTALLVLKDGVILHESYYQGTSAQDRRISWSMAKSFLSALIGVAVHEGKIKSIDDPVTKYVPALKGTAYDGATLRNVLNMASGVQFNEDYLDQYSDINKMGRVLALGGSMDKFALSLNKRARPPGKMHQYVSIDTHVIGMVLRAATGQSVPDYFVQNLWSKIGPEDDAYYLTDGYDVAFVLGGLNMRTRDYGLFGQLMLQNGQWQGQSIIPESWVAQSTQMSAPPDIDGWDGGYGYQWWIPKDSKGAFFADGIYGQFIYIDPASHMVIVKNSAHREFQDVSPRGQTYQHDEIDMFRGLVNYYSQNEMPR